MREIEWCNTRGCWSGDQAMFFTQNIILTKQGVTAVRITARLRQVLLEMIIILAFIIENSLGCKTRAKQGSAIKIGSAII